MYASTYTHRGMCADFCREHTNTKTMLPYQHALMWDRVSPLANWLIDWLNHLTLMNWFVFKVTINTCSLLLRWEQQEWSVCFQLVILHCCADKISYWKNTQNANTDLSIKHSFVTNYVCMQSFLWNCNWSMTGQHRKTDFRHFLTKWGFEHTEHTDGQRTCKSCSINDFNVFYGCLFSYLLNSDKSSLKRL